MTISAQANRYSYTGNGVTTSFAFSSAFSAQADLIVVVDGTTKTITTHYTISGTTDSVGRYPSGANVVFGTAPAADAEIVIYCDPAVVQELDLVENDPLPAEEVEKSLDIVTLLIRRLKDLVTRSLRLADSDVSGASVVVPTPSGDAILGWNAAGTALENKVPANLDLATVTAFIETLLDDADAATARTTLDAQQDVLTTIGDTVEATTAGAATRKAAHATVAAHATTMNPWVARKVTLSGSAVTFTDIADAPYVGASVLLVMNDAHIFTNGAVFDVQGGANYTAAAGDQVLLLATAVDAFDVTIFKADGTAVVGASAASDSAAGVIEIAIQSEMEAGSSAVLAVTPGRQQYHPSAQKAWGLVTISAGTPTLAAGYNFASITDNNTGDLTNNFTTSFSAATFAAIATAIPASSGFCLALQNASARAVGSFKTVWIRPDSGAATDPAEYSFTASGDQA